MHATEQSRRSRFGYHPRKRFCKHSAGRRAVSAPLVLPLSSPPDVDDMSALVPTFPSFSQALLVLDRLESEIKTADSFETLEAIARTAAALQRFSPVKKVSDRAGTVWIAADIRLRQELDAIERAKGAVVGGKKTGPRGAFTALRDDAPTLAELGLPGDAGKKRAARAKKLADIPDEKRDAFVSALIAEGKGVTPNAVLQKARAEAKQNKRRQVATATFSETGPFDVVVIDPPWPVQKIDRDERPNQAAFDYPVMSEVELAKWWAADMAPKLAADCHLFCWTTQKYLPTALRLVEQWGFKYVLVMVWHKPGGFQPIDLPQYNCEFIVYGRKGAPLFTDTTAFKCCFDAVRREHSRKPDYFYDTIRRVTGGSRIDVFSRERREGFAQYGNEPEKFAGAA
jgi:N6-adenosine-specific RNA methylase IME4